jgi:hypothetical protein
MVSYVGEFGMTAVARARVGAGRFAPQPDGKFDGLLAG